MMKFLREADASPVTEVAKKHGISGQTIVSVGEPVSSRTLTQHATMAIPK